MPPLKRGADHPGAAADRAFWTGPRRRSIAAGEGSVLRTWKIVEVVEQAVESLGGDGTFQSAFQPLATIHLTAASRATPTLWVLVMRIWPVEQAALLEPGRAGHLAGGIEREPAAERRRV